MLSMSQVAPPRGRRSLRLLCGLLALAGTLLLAATSIRAEEPSSAVPAEENSVSFKGDAWTGEEVACEVVLAASPGKRIAAATIGLSVEGLEFGLFAPVEAAKTFAGTGPDGQPLTGWDGPVTFRSMVKVPSDAEPGLRQVEGKAVVTLLGGAAPEERPLKASVSVRLQFGRDLSFPWALPFAGLLLCIAVLPLVAHHWWENNRNRAIVAAFWALPVLGMLIYQKANGGGIALGHAVHEYVAFIALLGSLYIISGGILITGDIRATPRNNTIILAIGGLLANLVGTTGASMLLIRPILRINSERHRTLHVVVFFIFIVSNCGGCLTPIGDPPLFLGYLRGVPFWWTLEVLWKEWLFVVGALLAIFFVWDTIQYRKETKPDIRADDTRIEPIRIAGSVNFLFLGGVIASVILLHGWLQAVGMGAMAVLSLMATPKPLRVKNGFSYGPINEVAILFAGIFVAMVPALQLLEVHGSKLGLHAPWQYFYATGILSSFLDNAPTYLTFFSTALGAHDPIGSGVETVMLGGVNAGVVFPVDLLAAISLGAVFMGANTYIGNGPNFMVKAIAEGTGQKMPSFFGYMLWSGLILMPLLVLTCFLFLIH